MYHLLGGFAIKICYLYADNNEESEELLNEAFVKLFKNISYFDEYGQQDVLDSLKGWFKRIIINTCIDHYKKKQSALNGQTFLAESGQLSDHKGTVRDVLLNEEMIEAVRRLPPGYRIVFNLFVIEGFSHEQISKRLGVSVGVSKSNLSKARENLRKLLETKLTSTIYVSPRR